MCRALPFALIILAACASDTSGPSLASRPVERIDLSEPVRQVAPPPAADASLAAKIKALVDQAEGGRAAFAALLGRAQSAARGAGAEGSEGWIAAQQQFSALEDARGPSTRALGELDSLISSLLTGGTEDGLVELQAAETAVSTIVDGQQAELNRLRETLSR